ncbi:hypothetical protein QK292_11195 [Arthrobacter sp. AL08]|uniref:hypothetical protein n=1 Tax=Micrococcaceae TaxID=1268 RepID=UPI00249AA693|nr:MULTISPECIES: hypothetical protein [Micrococcaceae]MDI3242259.1 hypothetical protein [Arthrobacter sp. AL05]MDI3278136.1 hypothetical protein [Arthrobacter sp. AL08]MDJ0353148.1 hypothetical protein [Pseudarthrobacter sp. PH31-O2]
MFTALLGRTSGFLRRAGMMAGLLALLAGIFGMHLMAGPHSMAASDSTHTAELRSAPTPAGSHTGHDAGATPSAEQPPSHMAASRTAAGHDSGCQEASCFGPGGCAEMSGMDPACIPLPGQASLAAPLPGTTVFGDAGPPYQGSACRHVYLPGAPSPGDLCISRT